MKKFKHTIFILTVLATMFALTVGAVVAASDTQIDVANCCAACDDLIPMSRELPHHLHIPYGDCYEEILAPLIEILQNLAEFSAMHGIDFVPPFIITYGESRIATEACIDEFFASLGIEREQMYALVSENLSFFNVNETIEEYQQIEPLATMCRLCGRLAPVRTVHREYARIVWQFCWGCGLKQVMRFYTEERTYCQSCNGLLRRDSWHTHTIVPAC